MKREIVLSHQFVEYIPSELEERTIYVSMAFGTVAHRCCCGCGNEVVTPLAPTDWTLIYDGESISLDPSIGNWNFPCQSHYWIENNKVKWALQMSKEEIKKGRIHDRFAKAKYFESKKTSTIGAADEYGAKPLNEKSEGSFWSKLKKWLS